GPAFVIGYALGFLHGVIDGIIDPFRLIFLIGRVLVTGAQAIGRALAPFLRASLLGEAALSPAFAGTTTGSAEPAAPAPLPGEPSDAQVAAALGPGTAAEVE